MDMTRRQDGERRGRKEGAREGSRKGSREASREGGPSPAGRADGGGRRHKCGVQYRKARRGGGEGRRQQGASICAHVLEGCGQGMLTPTAVWEQ
eukprot:1192816-Prorocentrum_minimum.AAC.1